MNNSSNSAFDSNGTKSESVDEWLKKNTYKSPYKVYKHKGKADIKAAPKKAAVVKPKTKKPDLLENALADRKRRYDPYSVVKPLSK